MSDRYLAFANSAVGSRLANALGLPRPVPLERMPQHGAAEAQGPTPPLAVVGGGDAAPLLRALARELHWLGVPSLAHAATLDWIGHANAAGTMSGRFNPAEGVRPKALLFDASAIASTDALMALYTFFHDTLASLDTCARVLVFGLPPHLAATPQASTAQRALEGFVRSLAKELKRGATAQLLYVAPQAHEALHSSLRFFLSPRAAYVDGQAITLQAPVFDVPPMRDARPLAGQVAVVTGAARGIGEAIACVLARDGAHVVCVDIPSAQGPLEAVASRLEGSALACDIAGPDAAATLLAHLATHAPRGLDVLVHNAGITRDKTLVRMSEAQWRSVLDINVGAPQRLNEALLEAGMLRANSRIVGVASISGIAGNRGQTNYAASKAAVIGMVEAWAPRLAQRRISINAVAPGFIETQMTAAVPFAIREAGRRMNSLGQGGQPVDVAETIAWLAHPASGALTGQVVRVCGQSLLGA
ncbi:3-oxoacyl-ACP reductase [Pandoraea nosoerga]|uniref:3-ketoacyl-ACP reductase n=1 Tax=Pandoraea nosoerga TaxID=2508296 RepID=A0A5E4SGX7_9BURK|nr:3-oxoacyl-ACP reductase [Pandoraea nosoerga]MBN4666995.1 3-oxoacyl-ACP reductase [Pandoraea nosoerga]MBN4674790.1 3-oxoacyl-ACP reductase [Pandoraea nosoerga]MBN4681768.1 3-oxoacyl-ACP reductase [Pandoraea nosoerga]MBN4744085.1 3-oxoacyl-ACP reductase [Pandoraea nosoerga]VVD73269.1 3-ketoacyl-ACP reductase [Pandoraea nosoerga]